MAKRKLSPTITLNTLESMIEYMLISSILERICEMKKNPLEYPRDNTRLDPLMHYLENMGNIMEGNNWQNSGVGDMVMGKCETWQK